MQTVENKHKLESMIFQAMDDLLARVDMAGVDHPHWDEDTAMQMANAATSVVYAVWAEQDKAQTNKA